KRVIAGRMPDAGDGVPYGRALGRECLDTLLLEAAVRAGATAWQPWRVRHIERRENSYVCAVDGKDADSAELHAPVVIAAHGSWDTGRLPLRGAMERTSSS